MRIRCIECFNINTKYVASTTTDNKENITLVNVENESEDNERDDDGDEILKKLQKITKMILISVN